MLIESTVHLPISLAMFQDLFHPPDSVALMRIILRWLHFVAGITWIGLLYFFNLVNVPFQKALDPDTKKKVNPDLLGRALWFFRWGAVVTVLVGLAYFAMYILTPDVNNANTIGGGHINVWWVLLAWLTYSRRVISADLLATIFAPLRRAALAGFWLDDLFEGVYRLALLGLARLVGWVDRYLVDGVVNVFSAWTLAWGDRLRRMQTGLAQDYVYGLAVGLLLLLIWVQWPR